MNTLLKALKYQDIEMLRRKASELKQTDGEGWAVGEMVECACCLIEGGRTRVTIDRNRIINES